MRTEITIDHENAAGRNYLTWAPVRATIKLLAPDDSESVDVELGNDDSTQGGQLEFGIARDQPRAATLSLTLPADGSEVEFFVAGTVGKPSTADGDAVIRSAVAGTGDVLSTKAVMVRVRKNANRLDPAERDRFTTALGKLNNQGAGPFSDFRAMHRENAALRQAHGAAGFLSWHRAYLLDLERELQEVDASVTLPYWRFDQPAPNVFTADFMGVTTGSLGGVTFSATNLLSQWQTDGQPGINRRPYFDVQNDSASLSDQATTLALGGARPNAVFDAGRDIGFDELEGDPHGSAHMNFDGLISDAGTAPRDPLFFLLHCNVDRLWALWQWFNDRFDGSQAHTYPFRDTAGTPGATIIGHNLGDTMWPWNDEKGGERPNNAPRTPFPMVPTAPAPAPAPAVGDMIDYLGFHDAGAYLGFAYDDVPYGVAP